METPTESPNNAPNAANGIRVEGADPASEAPSIFHRFQDLPQELRDSVWDAAARSIYEPYNAMTKENPRLFCMYHRSVYTLEPSIIDTRTDFRAAEEILIKGLLALLLASKESNEQSRRTILGCGSNNRSFPLLALWGYSYRGVPIRQLAMARNDVMCFCHCYSRIYTSNSDASQIATLGPQPMGSLLRLTPHLKTLYVDVNLVLYRYLLRRFPFAACELHGIDFNIMTSLCDLPLQPPTKRDEEGVGHQGEMADDEAVNGASSGKEVSQEEEGERVIDHRRIFHLLGPEHLRAFLEVWELCAEAGVKLQFVARYGRAVELFRQENS
ncbi:hypothetical protein PG985_010024 [Apiospora marii]|uniref:Uncharacterized protein n=1 Tax=Apiospora marii TaxID=335849 RepID=A0ABR1RKZ6_9PEZI